MQGNIHLIREKFKSIIFIFELKHLKQTILSNFLSETTLKIED